MVNLPDVDNGRLGNPHKIAAQAFLQLVQRPVQGKAVLQTVIADDFPTLGADQLQRFRVQEKGLSLPFPGQRRAVPPPFPGGKWPVRWPGSFCGCRALRVAPALRRFDILPS